MFNAVHESDANGQWIFVDKIININLCTGQTYRLISRCHFEFRCFKIIKDCKQNVVIFVPMNVGFRKLNRTCFSFIMVSLKIHLYFVFFFSFTDSES